MKLPKPAKTAIFVYGPDRVGKTTEINAACGGLQNLGYAAERYHFGPPSPNDPSGVKHYLDFFEKSPRNSDTIYLFDRGYGEAPFYEWQRRGGIISREDIQKTEMTFLNFFDVGSCINIIIQAPWSIVYPRHIEELRGLSISQNSDEHAKRMSQAQQEHDSYYGNIKEFARYSSIRSTWIPWNLSCGEHGIIYEVLKRLDARRKRWA